MLEAKDAFLDDVIETAMTAGRIMLENGAEIFRVEETMRRIAVHFGVEEKDFFVLTNGIFTSAEKGGKRVAKVNYIPVKGADLSKVEAVNTLSRKLYDEGMEIEDFKAELERIKTSKGYPDWAVLLAYALSTFFFAVLFGGHFQDSVVSMVAGIALFFFQKFSSKHLSKITHGILNGAVATAVCLLLYKFGLGGNLKAIIGGAVIVLVPGVAFVNGIRDLGDEDYLSGTVRLLDAITVFMSIALGVGFIFTVHSFLFGGVVL